MTKKYSENEKIAAARFNSLKSRVNYDLEKYWPRKNFINWYVNQNHKCCHCGCTLEELEKFYELTDSKIKNTRGRTLEIDRKEDVEYTEDNCQLSCYWCNNAKSDVFSCDEFRQIGEAIGRVIKNKIKI